VTAVAFDTLKLARKLRDSAKMSQEQAEGIADALVEAMSGAELATKADIAAVKADIAAVKAELAGLATKAELAGLATKAELKVDLAEAKADILRWMFAAMVGQTALIVGLIRMLGH
jgi:hypothetical protein